MTPEQAAALRERKPFQVGSHLKGEPVTPWNDTPEGQRGMRGAAARVLTGALCEVGTAGVIGAGSRFPPLGELDPAPAMAMALPEASYVVRSYGTPIAWWLGPEVYGVGDGKWIEVAEVCCPEYGRFSRTTSRHQNWVHAALDSSQAMP